MSHQVLIDVARIAPVAVTKYEKPFVVVMAVEEYELLTSEISTWKTNLVLRKREN